MLDAVNILWRKMNYRSVMDSVQQDFWKHRMLSHCGTCMYYHVLWFILNCRFLINLKIVDTMSEQPFYISHKIVISHITF